MNYPTFLPEARFIIGHPIRPHSICLPFRSNVHALRRAAPYSFR
ncbi:hypothetical protein SAMN05443245_7104 [Paraburkholderia fungorum]|uniref:Uncharacterized protein n=1 Tax=Paraburkholderia fungorum TaxID=134537 RepID=A0A1H1JQ12_9BURK|nr:hypothetical protein SAMN05443245_7104 [Paraburkholderia fungorum]